MLLQFSGKTMIENVIEHVAESESEGILVVLGANSENIVDLIRKYEVSYCYNENYKDGMLSSVQCGFRNLPATAEAVLVFQGDQPLITPAVINILINEYRSSDKGIIIPVHNGKRGHPLLLDKKYFDKIDKLDPGEGLRSITYIYSDDVLEVQTEEPGILRDFNTYDDYKKEVNQIK